MKIDGRQIANDILSAAKAEVASLHRVPVVRAVTVSPNAATESYLRVKSARAADAGMKLDVVAVENATTDSVIDAVLAPGADAVIVQLPLPAHIDQDLVLESIPYALDADVLSSVSFKQFMDGAPGALIPPVAGAVAAILSHGGVNPRGKRAVVIGYGRLVGQPVQKWLEANGATVDIHTRESGDLNAPLKDADIVVSGAGSPGLVKPEMLKPGVALIDAGTSESNGALVGDADPACEAVAAVFTPVPGGVGPIAVACLFRNVATLLTRP